MLSAFLDPVVQGDEMEGGWRMEGQAEPEAGECALPYTVLRESKRITPRGGAVGRPPTVWVGKRLPSASHGPALWRENLHWTDDVSP